MPARKPLSLSQRHDPPADKAARAAAEATMTPRTALTARPPADLKGHPHATAVWKRTLTLYGETEAKIVTGFDQGILVDYCLLVEQLIELDNLRAQSLDSHKIMLKSLKTLTAKLKRKDAKTALAEQMAITEKLEMVMGQVIKLDGRIDRKRALIHTLRQSLYLTPRSRAGVAPAEREEEIKDEMSKLLEEIA